VVDLREQHETVVVVAGGPDSHPPTIAIPAGALIIAADSGIDRALALGLHVDLAVGDFDSVSATGLEAVRLAGARIELALDAALAFGPRRILVVGSDAGRLDHLLSTLLLVGSTRFAECELDAALGRATAHVIRDERLLSGDPGELISLFALHGPAAGVTTEGLLYPLRGETLEPGSSRGVSNVFASPEARIELKHGFLLAVRPEGSTS
jgi:thiamine pyrophosphokinase